MQGRLVAGLLAVLLIASLAGCAQLAVKAASVGAGVAIDRRTAGAQLEDETIQLRAASALSEMLGPHASSHANVNVASYNRKVLLTGEVPDEATRQVVERVVSQLENVHRVFNELGIMPATSLPQRALDTYLTGRVKMALIDAQGMTVTAFRVVTERGTVYLMGRVTPLEAERATALVRRIGGVRRVVRMFEILQE